MPDLKDLWYHIKYRKFRSQLKKAQDRKGKRGKFSNVSSNKSSQLGEAKDWVMRRGEAAQRNLSEGFSVDGKNDFWGSGEFFSTKPRKKKKKKKRNKRTKAITININVNSGGKKKRKR